MIESIKKKMLKTFGLSVVIALVTTVCLIKDASCIDHRRHLFMLPNGVLQIEDEGFRWRNSFNFNLGAPIINWFFRNGAGFVAHATQADGIHAALSTIVNNIAALPPPPGGGYKSCSSCSTYDCRTKSK